MVPTARTLDFTCALPSIVAASHAHCRVFPISSSSTFAATIVYLAKSVNETGELPRKSWALKLVREHGNIQDELALGFRATQGPLASLSTHNIAGYLDRLNGNPLCRLLDSNGRIRVSVEPGALRLLINILRSFPVPSCLWLISATYLLSASVANSIRLSPEYNKTAPEDDSQG